MLAAVITLKTFSRWGDPLAFATSEYSLMTFGYLMHIQFGPRWRHNHVSRKPRWTSWISGSDAEKLQVRCSGGVVRVILADGICRVRQGPIMRKLSCVHLLNSHFPGNIVHACWSSF